MNQALVCLDFLFYIIAEKKTLKFSCDFSVKILHSLAITDFLHIQ